MRNLFPGDFSQQVLPGDLPDQSLPPSYIIPNPALQRPLGPSISSTSTPSYNTFQEANIGALNQIRNVEFPTIDSEDAAITQAILTVISSPSPTSSTSSHQPKQKISAFKGYKRLVLGPAGSQITRRVPRQNMLKRAIEFIRSSTSSLNRCREQIQIGSRSGSNQLLHMINERRRREKLNDNFEALRSLLPPGSKKDKASVLSRTMEYMKSLKAEVEELSRKNQMLVSQIQHNYEGIVNDNQDLNIGGDHQRLQIRIINLAADTTLSEARISDLRVNITGECSISDIAIRVLEFLKQVRNVSLLSVEANTRMVGTTSVTDVSWRLKIEGDEWDESTFIEAVKRVIADLAQ